MNLLVCSDLHNEFGSLALDREACRAADVIVLAGDVNTTRDGIAWADHLSHRLGDKPVIMVAGNHEFYGGCFQATLDELRKVTDGTPVQLLENDGVILDGVRFLGCTLWTDFELNGSGASKRQALVDAKHAMSDYRTISFDRAGYYRPLEPLDTLSRHQASRAWLDRQLDHPFDGPTVVVTHHAPSARSLRRPRQDNPLAPAYASHLEPLMGRRVPLWIHGHIHHSSDYVINGTRVVCNPRGYTPFALNPDFDPYKLISI